MNYFLLIFLFIVSPALAMEYSEGDKTIFAKKERFADRFFIKNTLLEIFGKSNSSTIDEKFFKTGKQVGGPCDIYQQVYHKPDQVLDSDSECVTGKQGGHFPHYASNNILRTAHLFTTCYEIIYRNPLSKKIMNQYSKAKSLEDLITAISKSFYPLEKNISLDDVLKNKYKKLPKNRELHQKILLTYCLSPDWQRL